MEGSLREFGRVALWRVAGCEDVGPDLALNAAGHRGGLVEESIALMSARVVLDGNGILVDHLDCCCSKNPGVLSMICEDDAVFAERDTVCEEYLARSASLLMLINLHFVDNE